MKKDTLNKLIVLRNQIENDYLNGINWVEKYLRKLNKIIDKIKEDDRK